MKGRRTKVDLVPSQVHQFGRPEAMPVRDQDHGGITMTDRKSTRLNSSHRCISYAVFCLKKKKQRHASTDQREKLPRYLQNTNRWLRRRNIWKLRVTPLGARIAVCAGLIYVVQSVGNLPS